MASDEQQQQETDTPEPEPIAEIVGRRLRELREEAGLRQADIAQAAVELGFKWGRSSVAALESGARKLSVEEMIALPLIALHAGLPDRSLIRDTDVVQIAQGYAVHGRFFRRALLDTSEHRSLATARREKDRDFRKTIFAVVPDSDLPIVGEWISPDERLRNLRFLADRYATMLIGMWLWPELDEQMARQAMARTVHAPEVDGKVGAKIQAEAVAVSLMAHALWGHSLTEERDARADARGTHKDARSLQGARAYVTRELTRELEEAWAAPMSQGGQAEFRKKSEAFKAARTTLLLNYDNEDGLEQAVVDIAKQAIRARGEALRDIPEELRIIFSDEDTSD
ncbi:helix-turn-helix transcriptional regulator [Streptomyces sp. NPDC006539]|uniref:helix-turn-helix transcriptional regulator n=1 Tax=Streptomyces sp. NPDC006539 TaxID=3155352 RepID=UPI0033A1EEAD